MSVIGWGSRKGGSAVAEPGSTSQARAASRIGTDIDSERRSGRAGSGRTATECGDMRRIYRLACAVARGASPGGRARNTGRIGE
ncbi:hypothetical protein GCM10022140_16510 [Rhodococcus aetherivorans]